MKRSTLAIATLCTLAPCAMLKAAPPAPRPRPPNVVVILADDLGYGDVSAYGQGKIQTPAIDALAKQGVRMTSSYSAASTCTPSRYALMTGEYPWREDGTGILAGDAAMIISPARLTLPRIFKNAGYATAAIGKWHLGLGSGGVDFNRHISLGPNELGFDYTFNMAATGDRVPTVYVENGDVVNLNPADPIIVDYEHKVGDWPTAWEHPELQRINLHAKHNGTIINGIGRIGFMSGGTTALWQDQSLGDTFNSKALQFIHANHSKPFFLYYAAHEPHVPRDPNPRFIGQSGVDARGDAVLQFNDHVASVMAKLREEGLEDNTLVLLTSDNGAFVPVTPGNTEHRPNGALRGGKYTDYEGGVRMPFIARWPGHIQPGSVCDQLLSQVDLPALAASLTHQPLAAGDAPDSFDPLPALTSCRQTRDHVLIGDSAVKPAKTARVIRQGDWKLIYLPSAGGKQDVPSTASADSGGAYPRLYDLRSDIGESTNVAGAHPDIVARLQVLLERASAAGYSRPGAQPVAER